LISQSNVCVIGTTSSRTLLYLQAKGKSSW